MPAATVNSRADLLPALVDDADVIDPASTAGAVFVPALVSDDDTIYLPELSAFRELRPLLLRDADTFYPASEQGGIPIPKHGLTGSVTLPRRSGSLAARAVLTGSDARRSIGGSIRTTAQKLTGSVRARALKGSVK